MAGVTCVLLHPHSPTHWVMLYQQGKNKGWYNEAPPLRVTDMPFPILSYPKQKFPSPHSWGKKQRQGSPQGSGKLYIWMKTSLFQKGIKLLQFRSLDLPHISESPTAALVVFPDLGTSHPHLTISGASPDQGGKQRREIKKRSFLSSYKNTARTF